MRPSPSVPITVEVVVSNEVVPTKSTSTVVCAVLHVMFEQ
jgi:hypothetical protein